MLPFTARSFPGYRLLTEYFAFPRKFLFVTLSGLEALRLRQRPFGNRLQVSFHLNHTSADLERLVSKETVRLGCTPVINLFEHKVESFGLDQHSTRYRIVADHYHNSDLEVYSIDHVSMRSNGERCDVAPFYSARHAADAGAQKRYWYATREPRPIRSINGQPRSVDEEALEYWISFVDLDLSPFDDDEWFVDVKARCFNRGVPNQFRTFRDVAPGITAQCLPGTQTQTRRRSQGHSNLWRLISHLSLNHLSISADDDSTDGLREILRLYDVVDGPATRDMIAGIVKVATSRAVAQAPVQTGESRPSGAFCRGIDVELEFDESKYAGSGFFLLASVLNHFFGLYASLNSFSRLSATTIQTRNAGEVWRWPARAGEKPLL